MKFELKTVKNGYILKVDDYDEKIVYQHTYEDEVERFADFLRYLEEGYGPNTGRYSEKRIYIIVEPGDKWEC